MHFSQELITVSTSEHIHKSNYAEKFSNHRQYENLHTKEEFNKQKEWQKFAVHYHFISNIENDIHKDRIKTYLLSLLGLRNKTRMSLRQNHYETFLLNTGT